MNQSRIYVGNLSYNVTDDQLRDYFGQYGQIEDVKLITDYQTGRSKGFGFITYTSADEAQASLAADEVEFEGRKLKVNIAKESRQRAGGAGGGGGGGGGAGSGGAGRYQQRRSRDDYR